MPITTSKAVRVRVGSDPTTGMNAATTNGHPGKKALSKVRANVEYKMIINSFMLFILMSIITITYFFFSFDLAGDLMVNYFLNCISIDMFTLINPLFLFALSSSVRKMFFLFLKGQKYSLY